jgi:tetratricopeptide (TPR) repeat protein/polysaccharide pyruvyl transferase WcaK-like protein
LNSQTARVDKHLQKMLQQAVDEQHQGKFEQAESRLHKLLKRYPEQPDALLQLAQIEQQRGHIDKALQWSRRATASEPYNPLLHYQLGILNQIAGDFETARTSYLECLRLAPDTAPALDNLGVVCQQLGQIEEARQYHIRALQIDPKLFGAWNNLGECERKLGRLQQAAEAYSRSVELNPDFDDARTNLGNAYKLLGDIDTAMACFAEVMQRNRSGSSRSMAEAHWQMALALLSQARYREGWLEYEWRLQVTHIDHPHWYGGTPWQAGQPMHDKHVLITREQGIGDEIMFAGCLDNVIADAGSVTLECNPRLLPLFARAFPSISVLPAPLADDAARHGNYDTVIGCGSLPGLYRNAEQDFPAHAGYLQADPERVAFWRNKINALGDGIKIGITWRGGAQDEDRRKRSAELADWQSLLEQPNVIPVNLQYGECTDEINAFKQQTGITIHDWKEHDPLQSLEEHAALISALDLVISIDNSTVHMAGALGKPCWVLLPAQCDWRWLRDRDNSPWYPSLRLFRQLRQGDWSTLFDELVRSLDNWQAHADNNEELQPLTSEKRISALLLNDTTDWYHWGCTATSTALRAQLEQLGLALDRIAINELDDMLTCPDSIEAFDSEPLFTEFCQRHNRLAEKIAAADMVIINGEGTLHGAAAPAIRLLYLAYIARLGFGKLVHIINHSCYPEDRNAITDTTLNALYKKVYQQVTSVAVREPVSAGLMQQLGIPVTQCFDCLPLYVESHAVHAHNRNPRHIVLAGSVSWDERYLGLFKPFIRKLIHDGYSLTLLVGARAHAAEDDRRLTEAMQDVIAEGLEVYEANSTREWLQHIADSAMLISGRFHHSIAAAFVGTPMIALGSNTPKIEGLMQMLDMPPPLSYEDPELENRLLERFVAITERPDDWLLDAKRRQALLDSARSNFTIIEKNARSLDETARRLALLEARGTDIERWSNGNNLNPDWDRRAGIAAGWIPDGSVVLDLGCGAMSIEAMLPDNCQYLPCDVVARDDRTRVCDFNKGEYPDPESATIITTLGVLEYLHEPESFIRHLADYKLPVVMSYCILEYSHGWDRNALGMANHLRHEELLGMIESQGLEIEDQLAVDNRQILLKIRPAAR